MKEHANELLGGAQATKKVTIKNPLLAFPVGYSSQLPTCIFHFMQLCKILPEPDKTVCDASYSLVFWADISITVSGRGRVAYQ